MMKELHDLLYRIVQEQRANRFQPLNAFGCKWEEVDLVRQLCRAGWIRPPRREDAMDGPVFHRIALTKSGILEWTQLHRMRADPSRPQEFGGPVSCPRS